MKKTSLIINIVLILAIAGLYVLHFTNKEPVIEEKPVLVSENSNIPAEIVFVNMDTLLNNLDMYIDKTISLQAEFNKSKKDFETRAKNFQQNISELQDKAQKGLITSSNYRKREEELQKEGQNLSQIEQSLSAKFNEEQGVMLRVVMFDIMNYIKKYNADKNYKYVINNAFGGTLLYGKESLNITQDIINGMNAEYAKKKK